ncbi:unnamed protein product [Urochloa humidicola]
MNSWIMLRIPMNKLQSIMVPTGDATGTADSKLICSDLRWPMKRCSVPWGWFPLRTTVKEGPTDILSHLILIGVHECVSCSVRPV